MAASPSSSSPSFECDAKLHPYQSNDDREEPRGAFSARKLKEGLSVRVDMPGVPNDGVKVVKYHDTRTVTFTGKAPKSPAAWWAPYDSSGGARVYGGYVVLDRDPAGVDVKADVKNGCLRLFFPASDGSLHFLSPLLDETGQDVEEKISGQPMTTFIKHDPQEASGIRLVGGRTDHINPYQLSGVKGVLEQKIIMKDEFGAEVLIYVRLDAPGARDLGHLIMENSDRGIVFAAMGKKDSFFDGGCDGRVYLGIVTPTCDCCSYEVVKHELKDGVLRFLARRKEKTEQEVPVSLAHSSLPPLTPGGPPRPSVLSVVGNLAPILGTGSREL